MPSSEKSEELGRAIGRRIVNVASIEPSQYLSRLSPEEAVAELRIHVEHLNEELQRHEQVFIRDELDMEEAIEEMRRLILEIELVKHSIAYFLVRSDFRPWDPSKRAAHCDRPHRSESRSLCPITGIATTEISLVRASVR